MLAFDLGPPAKRGEPTAGGDLLVMLDEMRVRGEGRRIVGVGVGEAAGLVAG